MTTQITADTTTHIATEIDGRSWKRYGLDKSSSLFSGYKVARLIRTINKTTSFTMENGDVSHMVELVDTFTNEVEYWSLKDCQDLPISGAMENLTEATNLSYKIQTGNWGLGVDKMVAIYNLLIDEEKFYLMGLTK